MKIPEQNPMGRSTPQRAAAPPPSEGGAVPEDRFTPSLASADPSRARTQGLPDDTLFVRQLPPVQGDFPPPPPAFKRPVLLVHGMNQSASFFFNLRNYLTSNEANRPGPDFKVAQEADFRRQVRQDPGAKVFTISFSTAQASFRDLAPELTRAIAAIREETGAEEIDVVAHSMGGLATREHLDGPHDGIKRFLMIATPNHGSLQADLALAADKLKVYRHYPPEALSMLRSLRMETEFMGRENNPLLQGLNERWEQQKAKVEPAIITGAGLPTPDWNVALFSTGDGLVTARSAWLPDTEYYVAEVPDDNGNDRLFSIKYNHGQIQDQPPVAQLVGEFLGRG